MKQKDIALVAVVAIMASIFSIVIATYVIAPASGRKANVQVVDVITSDFPPVDERYFNDKSINQTQKIQIGQNNNNQPFNN